MRNPRSGRASASLSESTASPRRDRPVDRERRVVPDESAVACRGIEFVDLVGDHGVGLERAEPVGKAARNEQLLAVPRRSASRRPSGRRSASRTRRSTATSYTLPCKTRTSLACAARRQLEMQAADGAAPGRIGLVVLHERRANPDFRKSLSVVALDEIAARVLALRRHDPQHIADFQPVYSQVRQEAPHAGAGLDLPIRLCRLIGRAAPRVKSSGPRPALFRPRVRAGNRFARAILRQCGLARDCPPAPAWRPEPVHDAVGEA